MSSPTQLLHPSRSLGLGSVTLLLLALPLLALPLAAQTAPGVQAGRNEIRVPPTDANLETLDLRVFQQLQSIWKFEVPYDFRFSDQRKASGITFLNVATDDSLRDYKPVHYDHGNGLAAADVDGDGRIDLFFLSQLGGNQLWRNLGGGRFENITEQAGVELKERVAVSASFADIDKDGDADLFVTTVRFGNVLFENDGKGHFRDMPETWNADNNVLGNSLFHNLGEDRFEELSQQQNVENYWPWGFSAADLNADGWQDVFVTASMNYPFRYGVNSLLLNNAGKGFLDAEFITGLEPRANVPYKVQYELDCSGSDQAHRLCQGKAGNFKVLGSRGSRSSVIFDLEGDGDLDIVTNELNDVPMVLLSDFASRGAIHWLSIELEGKSSNRDGLGAQVTVRASGRKLTQWHDGKSGYLSQSSLPLYFGLGAAETINSIEVLWPSGKSQEIKTGLAINRLMKIQEP